MAIERVTVYAVVMVDAFGCLIYGPSRAGGVIPFGLDARWACVEGCMETNPVLLLFGYCSIYTSALRGIQL